MLSSSCVWRISVYVYSILLDDVVMKKTPIDVTNDVTSVFVLSPARRTRDTLFY